MGEALTRIEQLITQYLYEYGNTREVDLIEYVSRQGYSREWVKKVIKKLYDKKEIDKIKHPNNAVYLTLKKHVLPLELEKELIKAQAVMRAAELQAYGEIDKNRPAKEYPKQTLLEVVEDLIKTKTECEEAIKKLKEHGFKKV